MVASGQRGNNPHKKGEGPEEKEAEKYGRRNGIEPNLRPNIIVDAITEGGVYNKNDGSIAGLFK